MNNGRKINVLHFINSIEAGGAEMNLLSIVKGQDKKKFNIFVAYSLGGLLEEQFKTTNSFLYKFQSSKVRFRDFSNLTLVLKLSRFIKKHKIDIIHAHAFVPHLWGLLTAKITSIPIIRHFHGSTIYSVLEDNLTTVKGHPTLEKMLISKTDANIVITKATYRTFIDLGFDRKRIVFIPNGINLPEKKFYSDAHIEATRNDFGISEGPVVCTIGRLDKNKNQQILLRTAPRILEDFPNTKFLIVGEGPLKTELEELSLKLNLAYNVIFTGYRSDIYSILEMSDIFVLPSLSEFHPVTVLEAMAMKKPVIASPVGHIPDTVIHGKTGLLVTPNDENALRDTIIQLLRNKEKAKRMGMEGYENVKENFSNEKVIKKIEQLYYEVLT